MLPAHAWISLVGTGSRRFAFTRAEQKVVPRGVVEGTVEAWVPRWARVQVEVKAGWAHE